VVKRIPAARSVQPTLDLRDGGLSFLPVPVRERTDFAPARRQIWRTAYAGNTRHHDMATRAEVNHIGRSVRPYTTEPEASDSHAPTRTPFLLRTRFARNETKDSVSQWVSYVDWSIVVLAVLSVCIFTFGGFREQVAGVTISIKSWTRLFAAAALLTGIRHAFVLTPSMPQLCAHQAVAFWRSDARRDVWPAFISTRLTVLLVGYLAVVTFGVPPGIERFRVSHNQIENLLARWDVAWYLGIITKGYEWDGNAVRQQSVVFFPAFPIITRAVGLFIGQRWLLAGLFVALSAFFVALVYMYRLARDVLDPEQARVAVWALAAYPFSAYYSVPYTEALYLLCSVTAFYHVNRANWLRAAALGYVVGLCRPNGFLIALPFGILVLQHMIRERRVLLTACTPVIAPIAGILSYSFFLYLRFGDPLAWRKGQLAWGRAYVGIWSGLEALWTDRYDAIVHYGLYDYSSKNPYDLMYTVAAVFVLVSVVPTIRRFGLAYGVFTLVNILPPLMIGGMMSIGRMTSVLFPAFLWLGSVVPPRYVPAMIAVFCTIQGLVAALFFDWRPIF